MPEPRTSFDGPVFEFDIPRLSVGVAEYDEGPTGCTVFHFDPGVRFVADIRGGSPGTVNADFGFAQALCFAGGSLLGLEATSGVASAIFNRRGHDHVEWSDIPLVAGAIIFDFKEGRSALYPDAALGRAALEAAVPGRFPLGERGAARSATVGKAISLAMGEPGGQGAAIRHSGKVYVAAFTVINALGAVHDRTGAIIRGNRREDGNRVPFGDHLAAGPGNTTLTLIVTNLRMGTRPLEQSARQAHASMARAIQPFHTELDGDVLFFATTDDVEDEAHGLPGALGTIAGEVAWDAVLSAFPG